MATTQTLPDGGTALNTSVVDAVAHVRETWDPDRANLVMIFTDGRDEDAPGTLDLASSIAALQAGADPARPVQLAIFGYGAADTAALQQMVDANGGEGGVYPIASSAQVLGAFAEAVGDGLIFP